MTSFEIGKTGIMIEYLSLLLKNNYYSDLKVSEEYTVSLGKCIYNYLKDTFPKPSWDDDATEYESISDYYLSLCLIEDDTHEYVTPTSVDDIEETNIVSWRLDNYVTQYIFTNTVINENTSTLEEIALAQELLSYFDSYTTTTIGEIDKAFNIACFDIQKIINRKTENLQIKYPIPKTGYFDIFVETYLRNLQEGGAKL